MSKWEPQEGQYRVVGEGDLGVYQGKPIYTLEAAKDRLKVLDALCKSARIEKYVDGKWRKLC